ncbi:hypothetical protein L210DRAFT_3591582 [Boletus edulis BED1]|uniref:Uncharacterized protein n=1 Tax=Boletus edulis BED1 TaxID=1328754 RepID=A0AAD4BA93_BOLED|nr:hypothetical protein L210DRAFT_3591582 [Boletus edulis BED1]
MRPGSYMLEWNRTHLLFIPPLDLVHDPSGTVVQVCIRSDHEDGDTFTIFTVEQASITMAIETLLVGHVTALHKLPECVIIEEIVPGYTLTGVRKPWKYGRGKTFSLGTTMLEPAEHKWIFRFEKSE